MPPSLFCLSKTCAWSCYPAGWITPSGHRGDNAVYGMGCVVFVSEGVDGWASRRGRGKVALFKEWIVAAACSTGS